MKRVLTILPTPVVVLDDDGTACTVMVTREDLLVSPRTVLTQLGFKLADNPIGRFSNEAAAALEALRTHFGIVA